MRLERLQHRWAAMNPPSPDDIENANSNYYLGAEPLDPALADRFPFIIFVPTWGDLSEADRRHIINWNEGDHFSDFDLQQHLEIHPLPSLVARCATYIRLLEDQLNQWLGDYVLYAFDLLEKARLGQSPRRARMLARSIVAVHAARMLLESDDVELDYSAEIALTYSLPENASEVPPAAANVLAIHRQAWEIASLDESDEMRRILIEPDPLRRVLLASQLDVDMDLISRLVTQALGSAETEARRMSLATAIFLVARGRWTLRSAAWEPLVQYARRVIEPRTISLTVQQGQNQNILTTITNWIDSRTSDSLGYRERLERNFVVAGFPDLWVTTTWQDGLKTFQQDLELFGLQEETA
jgi:hypothetical protein